MSVEQLTDKEIEGLGDIIEGTIDTLIDFLDEGEDVLEAIDYWNGIRVKLGLEKILPPTT